MTRLSGWRAAWCALVLALLATPALVAPAQAATVTVSGTVTLPDGTPVAGARVTAFTTETTSGPTVATTDADGHYALGVEPRTYRFEIRSGRTITRWYGGGEAPSSGVAVDVAAPRDVSAVVEPGVRLEGTYPATATSPSVVAQPVTGSQSVLGTSTAAEGRFEAWLTTESPVHVGMRMTSPEKLRLTRWNGGTYAPEHSTPVQGSGGGSVTGLAFELPAGVHVRGTITNATGGPLWTQAVRYVWEDEDWVPIGTNVRATSEGRYDALVPAGESVTLHVDDHFGEGYEPQWLGGTGDSNLAARLHPIAGEDIEGADIALPGGPSVTGRVVDAAGLPVPGVTVTAYRAGTEVELGTALTDERGAYALPGLGYVSTGSARLRFSGEHLVTSTTVVGESRRAAPQVVTFDPAFQLDPPGVPTLVGSGLVGSVLTASTAPGDPDATSEELHWYCGSRALGVVGTSYRVTAADDGDVAGCALNVRQVSRHEGWGNGVTTSRSLFARRFEVVQGFVYSERTVGTRLWVRQLEWTAKPDRIAYQWLRNGVAIPGATAPTYLQRNADVGREISVRLTGYRTADGLTTTQVLRGWYRTKARSYIRVRVEPRRAGGVITVWVATPGVARPGGEVGILRNGNDHLAHLRITSTPRTVRYRLRDWSGRHRLVVYYSGSPLVAPVRTTVTFVTR